MAAPLIIRDQRDRPDQQEVVVMLVKVEPGGRGAPAAHPVLAVLEGENKQTGVVHTINLTGRMAGYGWSINNVVWNKDVPPLPIAKGERVELVIINRTPMPHPMHLHGHEFQFVEIDGQRFAGAVRDTVLVPPERRVVVAFDADNPGLWAFHCHLLYHLEAGMFVTFRYVTVRCHAGKPEIAATARYAEAIT